MEASEMVERFRADGDCSVERTSAVTSETKEISTQLSELNYQLLELRDRLNVLSEVLLPVRNINVPCNAESNKDEAPTMCEMAENIHSKRVLVDSLLSSVIFIINTLEI